MFLLPRLLNYFFDLLYNEFAWTYDLVSRTVSLGLWDSWVASLAEDISHSPVLETGHGPGHLLQKLQDKNLRVFGIDASYRMGRLAYLKGEKEMMGVVNGYAQYLPFADCTFSAIVATFPSNYILERATWLEFKRVLRPEGTIFWLPAAWITSSGLPYRLAAWLFWITHQVPSGEPGQKIEQFEMLEELGFNISQEFRPLDKSVVWIVRATQSNIEC